MQNKENHNTNEKSLISQNDLIKKVHISIIIIGIIFIFSSLFHTNIWFDEAYSVGLANHSFIDIWKIGGHDVHPILYYWILHIIALVTGSSILAYRIFSGTLIAILGILGYTHIRKDFGEKTGLIFSCLTYFMPAVAVYANQIRMYSLAILSVTILGIYAYRLMKDQCKKNWIIFFISSLVSIYTHYYGLMAAGIINLFLFGYFIKNKNKKQIIIIIAQGLVQAIAYIPWLMYFMIQLKNISGGFWIGFEFPKTLFELLGFQYIGNMKNEYIGFYFSIGLFILLIVLYFKNKKQIDNRLPIKLSIAIYLIVIIAALIMTAILGTLILYYRYLFVITGLFIFAISYILAKTNKDYIAIIVCLLTIILGTVSNTIQIINNYDQNNLKQIEFIKENIQNEDIVVYKYIGNGAIIAVDFKDNKQYFYNADNWNVEDAYKAFGYHMETCTNLDFLENYKGRIWVVDQDSFNLYNEVFNNEEYNVLKQEKFKIPYQDDTYGITLVKKK